MRHVYDIGIREVKCYRCGKVYIEKPFHIFKSGKKHFCSYSCHNAHLTEIEAKKKGGRT